MPTRLDQSQALLLGARIRKARLARALSLIQVARQCELHHSQLSRMEQGKFKRVAGNVQIVCEYLHIKPFEALATTAGVAQLHARLDALVSRDARSVDVLASLLDVLDGLPAGAGPPA